MTVDTNLAILIGIGICAVAHVLVTLIESDPLERDATEDAAVASAALNHLAAKYPPGTELAVTVGDVTVEVLTPEPADDDGDEWKQRA